MTKRNLIVVPSPKLTIPAREITNIDDSHISLAEDMIDLMYLHHGIGLAANQVGESLSLIVVDISPETKGSKFKPRVLFNPRIISSYGSNYLVEGCLSVPGLRLGVTRPAEILVTAQDTNGKDIEFEADKMLARVLQHEIDHLFGRNLFERLDPKQKTSYLLFLKESSNKS